MRALRKTFWSTVLYQDRGYKLSTARSLLRSYCFVAWYRLQNRALDARAWALGACNASTWNKAARGYDGGYSHWRCGKRRGHDPEVKVFRDGDYVDGATYGPHRFNNYIWEGPGSRVEYAPLPIHNEDNTDWFNARKVIPFMKVADGRRACDTRRRSRIRARVAEESLERYRRQPRKIPNPFKSDADG